MAEQPPPFVKRVDADTGWVVTEGGSDKRVDHLCDDVAHDLIARPVLGGGKSLCGRDIRMIEVLELRNRDESRLRRLTRAYSDDISSLNAPRRSCSKIGKRRLQEVVLVGAIPNDRFPITTEVEMLTPFGDRRHSVSSCSTISCCSRS